MNILKEAITNMISISEEKAEVFMSFCYRKSFKKKDMTLTPEEVGVPIINAIGNKTTTLPGFLTKFLVYNLRTVPRWAVGQGTHHGKSHGRLYPVKLFMRPILSA